MRRIWSVEIIGVDGHLDLRVNAFRTKRRAVAKANAIGRNLTDGRAACVSCRDWYRRQFFQPLYYFNAPLTPLEMYQNRRNKRLFR